MAITHSSDRIGHYTRAILDVFKVAPDKRAAHARSRPILEDLAADPSFLTAAFARRLTSPDGLTRKHYPAVTITLEFNAYFGLDVNCWLPLPSRATDVTT